VADDIRLVLSVDDRDLIRARKEQEKYQFRIAQIEKEFRKGNITAARYNKELANQARELAKLGGGYNKANSEIRKYAYGLRQATDDQLNLAQAMTKSGKGMRRMEILAQQAGYQIGDFAVQVQSGTNVAVAFGQQMSQLLGFFGPYGAIAGAAVAIGTGLIAPLLKAKKEAENLKESLEDLRDSEDMIKKLGDSIDKNLIGKFDDVRKEFGSLVADIYKFQAESLKKAITAGFGGIAGQAVGMGGIGGYGPSPQEMTRREIQVEDILGGIGGNTAQEVAKSVQEAYDKLSQLPFITEEAKKNFRQIALDNGIIADLVDYQEEGFKKQAATAKKLQQIQTDAMAMEAEIAQEQLDNIKRNYTFAGRLMQEAATEQAATDAGRQSRIEANYKIAGRLMQEAEDEQRKLVEDTHSKMMALQKAFYDDAKKQAGEVASATYMANYKAVLAYQAYGQSRMAAPEDPVEPKKTPKASTIEDTIKQLQRQADKDRQLVQLTGQKRREEELFIDLKNANADADIKTSETRLRTISQEISAMEERHRVIEQARQQQEDLKNTIESSMEDAFISIVDGTKSVTEAFKDMARQIIAELFRVMVVQRTVRAITGALPFANGGVFQGGSQVKAFASGGVVGGPTYFPMSGGKTGLMGEAGPEAIMPLKRGRDGKLGVQAEGGGNITVNQTINVSTGVQQTVRTEIKSLMPQIAENAKAAVADAKRRGGSYGKAF